MNKIQHAVLLPILVNLLGHLVSGWGDVIMIIMQDFPDVYIEKAQSTTYLSFSVYLYFIYSPLLVTDESSFIFIYFSCEYITWIMDL